jgi:hypothetical protein
VTLFRPSISDSLTHLDRGVLDPSLRAELGADPLPVRAAAAAAAACSRSAKEGLPEGESMPTLGGPGDTRGRRGAGEADTGPWGE